MRGEPIKVDERTITPEAEVVSWQLKDAKFSDRFGASLWGLSFRRIRPTALIDRSGEVETRTPIIDRNRQLEIGLLIAAVLIAIALNAVEILTRRARADGQGQ